MKNLKKFLVKYCFYFEIFFIFLILKDYNYLNLFFNLYLPFFLLKKIILNDYFIESVFTKDTKYIDIKYFFEPSLQVLSYLILSFFLIYIFYFLNFFFKSNLYLEINLNLIKIILFINILIYLLNFIIEKAVIKKNFILLNVNLCFSFISVVIFSIVLLLKNNFENIFLLLSLLFLIFEILKCLSYLFVYHKKFSKPFFLLSLKSFEDLRLIFFIRKILLNTFIENTYIITLFIFSLINIFMSKSLIFIFSNFLMLFFLDLIMDNKSQFEKKFSSLISVIKFEILKSQIKKNYIFYFKKFILFYIIYFISILIIKNTAYLEKNLIINILNNSLYILIIVPFLVCLKILTKLSFFYNLGSSFFKIGVISIVSTSLVFIFTSYLNINAYMENLIILNSLIYFYLANSLIMKYLTR